MVDLLLVVFLLNVVLALSLIFFERKNPTAAVAWVMVLLLLPYLGLFLYLLFGQNYTRQRLFTLKEKDDRLLQGMFEEQKEALLSRSVASGDSRLSAYRTVVYMLLRNNRAILTTDNRVKVFVDGNAKFEAMLEAIRSAREHIHVEYYIIRDDELGRKIIVALAEKAREGLEVRLLYDAVGTRLSRAFFKDLAEAGGDIAAFFPSRIPFINLRINYRNHRKIAIIDGTTGFIGGFNIGDEYLGKGPLGYWRDTHLQITGSAVNMLQLRFFLDWNYAAKVYLGSDERYFPAPTNHGDVAVQIVSSGPDTRWSPMKEGYLKLITSAKERIFLQSPYFVPDESVLDALRIAALSGVDVRIMIPSKPDHPFVYWASLSFLGDLLDVGVRGFTYDHGFIHAKTIVVDGIAGSVGSANWDIRSFRLNFEANAFIYNAGIASELEQVFLRDLDSCTEITAERYSSRSLWIKMKESVSRLFSPIG